MPGRMLLSGTRSLRPWLKSSESLIIEGLEVLLAGCGIPATVLRCAAIAITALVVGLWLELCLSPGSFTADEACAIARAQLDAIISTNR